MTTGRLLPGVSLQELRGTLDAYADLEPPPCCWLSDDGGDSFCPTCAPAAAEKRGAEVDGGYYGQGESDHGERCTTCGQILDYRLTDYGALEELAHFENYPVDGLPSRETAYEMAAMLSAMADDGRWSGRAIAVCEPVVLEIVRRQA